MKQHMTSSKKRLILHLGLTIFTLFALVISMVAWLSTRQYAEITSINLSVERKEIEVTAPTFILLPCATKIGDSIPGMFNNECVFVATYVIKGEGQLYAEVHKNEQGLLGYVWDDAETARYTDSTTGKIDYYTAITDKLKAYSKVDDISKLTYDDLQDALASINRHPAGKTVEGDTVVTILYWAEYDLASATLNQNGAYNELEFNADVTFVS